MRAQPVPEGLARHAATAAGHEQRVADLPGEQRAAGLGKISLDARERRLADRHQALARTLAEHHQHAAVQVHLLKTQADQLAHPQPARVQQLQHGGVAQRLGRVAGRRGQQALDVGFAKRLRQRPTKARRVDAGGRVFLRQPFAHEIAVKPAHGRQAPGERSRRKTRLFRRGEIREQVGPPGGGERHAAGGEMRGEAKKIGAVRGERQAARAALQPQAVEELLNERIDRPAAATLTRRR
jgi:hypothetical protein